MTRPILVLDCNYLCHRARHSMRGLEHHGTDTGVIYGFLVQLLTLGRRFGSNTFAFCWDSKKSYRKLLFPAYKAKRREVLTAEQEQQLVLDFQQFTKLRREILPAMGFKNVFIQAGCESDDLMARIALDWMDDLILVTADEDLLQCLYPWVKMFNPTKNLVMDMAWVKTHKGAKASQWWLLKSLTGCAGDGVPGIKGVGEKTAAQYLRGELKEGAKLTAIRKALDSGAAKRTEHLVRLPFPKTRPMEFRRDVADFSSFMGLCIDLGFESFMGDGEHGADAWENFLSPAFEYNQEKQEAAVRRNTRGGIRRRKEK